MIANAIWLRDSEPQPSDVDARLSVPVLEAALEVGRQDRRWLKQKLTDRKTESDALREELRVLNHALPEPSHAGEPPTETTAPALTLATQLRHRLKALWDERERLLRVLQEAAREREQMVASLEQAARDADDAARLADQATRAAAAAAGERDALAAELARQRLVLSEARPAAGPPVGADADEIARALEMMAGALGDLRQRIVPLTTTPTSGAADDALLTGRLQTLLAPLASLPDVQAQLGSLTARMEELANGHAARSVSGSAVIPGYRTSGIGSPDRVAVAQSVRPLLSVQALERALTRGLTAGGFVRGVVGPLLAAWLAGAVPLISGRHALAALRASGRLVAANRTLILPITAEMTDTTHLFGTQAADGGDQTSVLADFLIRAGADASRDGLSLVVLDGLNHAAADRVVVPLLQHIAARDTSPHDVLDRFLPAGLADDPRYAPLAASPWPRNVLLAATLDADHPTAALPPGIWAHGLYLCLDHVPETAPGDQCRGTNGRTSGPERPSFVPAELWASWTAEVRDEADASGWTHALAEPPAGHHEVVQRWRLFEAALTVLGRSRAADRGGSVLLQHAVVPWSVSVGLANEATRLPATPATGTGLMTSCECLERVVRGDGVRMPPVTVMTK